MAKLTFSPEALPIHSRPDEGAVAAFQLSAAALRSRFHHPPDWQPELQSDSVLQNPLEYRLAAVLIPLLMREQGLSVLLTERAADLQQHAGQISFPGGRVEPDDGSAVATALRESEEEIGLPHNRVEVLGELPEYRTGTGYQVTPVVGLIQPGFELRTDPGEVASVFEVPLDFLMNSANHQRRLWQTPDGSVQRLFYAMPYQQHFIWGATAGMLRNLFHFLRT